MNYSGHMLGYYRLNGLIGSGGFADVYDAHDIFLERHVAIKVLHPQITQIERKSFLKEARVVNSMEHHNIIKVIEFDVDNGIPYIVMSHAPNGSFRDLYPLR